MRHCCWRKPSLIRCDGALTPQLVHSAAVLAAYCDNTTLLQYLVTKCGACSTGVRRTSVCLVCPTVGPHDSKLFNNHTPSLYTSAAHAAARGNAVSVLNYLRGLGCKPDQRDQVNFALLSLCAVHSV